MSSLEVDVAIIGAGSVGIAVAYYLAQRNRALRVALIDTTAPMSLTSAHSGENYRNWWPHPVMRRFVDHSIDLMETLARDSDNRIGMSRRGYVLATRRTDTDDLVTALAAGYDAVAPDWLRIHDRALSPDYRPPIRGPWEQAPDGLDVLASPAAVQAVFPTFQSDIANVVHVRRGGDVSGQQMGQLMLEHLREAGLTRVLGQVTAIERSQRYSLILDGDIGTVTTEQVVNAAGPFVGEIAGMLGESLPITNILQQKVAFEDIQQAVPRDLPFCIDIDPQTLDWTDEERELLAGDSALTRYIEEMPGAVHCRPEGAADGKWVKLGWAINESPSEPSREPMLDDTYPELVLRAAARMQPRLASYLEAMPRQRRHYGGYYTLTDENWPLVGPMDAQGAFVAGALSGFGTMAACATGDLCAAWVSGDELPAYATALSPERYQDAELMDTLHASSDRGIL
jgi:glycine/D-amino acid oxidase-like deaminating enzyme